VEVSEVITIVADRPLSLPCLLSTPCSGSARLKYGHGSVPEGVASSADKKRVPLIENGSS